MTKMKVYCKITNRLHSLVPLICNRLQAKSNQFLSYPFTRFNKFPTDNVAVTLVTIKNRVFPLAALSINRLKFNSISVVSLLESLCSSNLKSLAQTVKEEVCSQDQEEKKTEKKEKKGN